ncbi:hypothetical protein Gohar_026280, partial [Gossypium harknessii]|nr:hypothetical protein [Gossypium harknessii]
GNEKFDILSLGLSSRIFFSVENYKLYKLLQRGRAADAEAEFEKLLGGPYVKSAMAELSKSDRGDEADTFKFSELLYGHHRKVVFIGSTLFALQQLSGINAVFYFSSTVFETAGVPSESANMCVGIANLLGSFVAMILMDRLGRKVLLIGSFSGMVVAMFLQITSATSLVSRSSGVYLSVGGMLLSVLTFAIGAGPVPSILLSEMFPGRVRANAVSVCMAFHWGASGYKYFIAPISLAANPASLSIRKMQTLVNDVIDGS